MTSSTILKQVHSLEEKLGVKLFAKTSNRVKGIHLKLTEDGAKFYEKAIKALEKVDGLFIDYLQEKKDQENRKLVVTATAGIFKGITKYIKDFQTKSNIDIDLQISFKNRNLGLNSLLNGKCDIFISIFEENEELQKNINFKSAVKYKPYLLLYKNHKLKNKKSKEITKKDILDNNFIFDYNVINMLSLKKFIDDNDIVTDMDIFSHSVKPIKNFNTK